MANVNESIVTSSMQSELNAGLNTVSGNQEITFYKYTRAVLPVDGYVFWVKDLITPPLIVQGSLHYSTDQQQRTDETIGINKVIFTTQQEVEDFNVIAENSTYIGQIDLIRFAFTSRGNKYQNAGTYHYRGDAIYPAMYSQIIDNPSVPLDLGSAIATNSMPIWLSLNSKMPIYPENLVPSNILPPYAAIEIKDTKSLQSAPYIEKNSSHDQLLTEKVKVIMYGLRNDQALDYQDYILNYSLNYGQIGIQNMPIIVDEKRGQSELGIIAQKKSIEFEINYYQSRALAIAQQLILTANIQFSAV